MKPTILAVALAMNLATFSGALALDPGLPAYMTAAGISGQIKSVGSDTLNNEMTLWTKGFKSQYPNVKIDVEGQGSATAPPALLEGTSQFAPMSRLMTTEEVEAFAAKYGYRPIAVRRSRRGRCARDLCQQGQPHPLFDAAATQSHLLVNPQSDRRR